MEDLTSKIKLEDTKEQNAPLEFYDVYLGDQSTPDSDTSYFVAAERTIPFYNLADDLKSYLPLRMNRTASKKTTVLEIETISTEFDNVDQAWSSFVSDVDLRGKRIVIRRSYRNLLSSGNNAKVIFDGIVNKVLDITEEKISIELKIKQFRALSYQTGRMYQLYCGYVLGGTRCGFDKDSTKVTGTADSGTTGYMVDAARTEAEDYWKDGYIVFSSGDNDGEIRIVKEWDWNNGKFTFDYALPNTIAAGDNYTLYQGCDKSLTKCKSRFANQANFGGFPHIPQEMNPIIE